MQIGDRIKARRIELGMSQDDLAKKIGYKSRSSINKIELGQYELRQSKIAAFAEALNTTATYILGLEDAPQSSKIPQGCTPLPQQTALPVVGQIACGQPILAEQNITEYRNAPTSWKADFALICHGDSMEPKIHDGDVVAIRQQNTVENGQIAAVRIGEEATLKMVYFHDRFVEFRPLNTNYESIIKMGDELEDVAIEGLAVGYWHTL